jgi:hypothetical protein
MIYVRKLNLSNFTIPRFDRSQYNDLVSYCGKGKLWPFRFVPTQEKGRVSYFEFHPIFAVLEYLGYSIMIIHAILITLLNANSHQEFCFFPDNQISLAFYYYYGSVIGGEMIMSAHFSWFAQYNLMKKQSRNYYRIIIKLMKSKRYSFEEMELIVEKIQEEIWEVNSKGKIKNFLNFIPPYGECSSPGWNLFTRR